MASIRVLKRKKMKDAYQVIYTVSQEQNPLTGRITRQSARKQFETKKEALKFKAKVEKEYLENMVIKPSRETVTNFLYRWIEVYAKERDWTPSTYTGNLSMIENHIIPVLGGRQIQKLTPQDIDLFFAELKYKKVLPKGRKKVRKEEEAPFLSSKSRREIYNVLKSAFDTAKRWKLIEHDLVTCKRPEKEIKEILTWDQNGIRTALDSIKDKRMHLAVHMSFACTMRIGEIAGLQWKYIDLENDKIYVRQILQRVTKESLDLLKPKIFVLFPDKISNSKTSLVLKEPKTKSSVRDLHISSALKEEILAWKEQQEKDKLYHGSDYNNYELFIAHENGDPTEVALLSKYFRQWQKEHDIGLEQACFHSLRHSSITSKLKASGGDIKSVQADSGHSSANMILNVYAHAQESDKKEMNQKFEASFYSTEEKASQEQETLQALIDKCNDDPKFAQKLLSVLSKKAEKKAT